MGFYLYHHITYQNHLLGGGGAIIQSPGGGGGFLLADKLFLSTRLNGELNILYFITCLFSTVVQRNYLFHEESEIIYFRNTPAVPLVIEWCPP